MLSPREDSPAPGVYERRQGRVVRVGVVDEEEERVGKVRWGGMGGGGERKR